MTYARAASVLFVPSLIVLAVVLYAYLTESHRPRKDDYILNACEELFYDSTGLWNRCVDEALSNYRREYP